MPYLVSSCWCDGTEKRMSQGEPCPKCGKPGQPARWVLTMHEAMARYQYVTGLKPVGPHRPMADEVIGPLRDLCMSCAGHGLCMRGADDWRLCPDCEGTGAYWTVKEYRIRRALKRILKRFPEAAAPDLPGFVRYPLAYDLDEEVMVAGP